MRIFQNLRQFGGNMFKNKVVLIGGVLVLLAGIALFIIQLQKNYILTPVMNTGVEDQNALRTLPRSKQDGLPPTYADAPGASTSAGIIPGKFPEDPTALEKSIPIEVTGLMTGLPKTRGTTQDENYAYMIPESGAYKGKELTLLLIMVRKKDGDGGRRVHQLLGKRVRVKGEIYRQYIDPKKPTQIQRVVWVSEVESVVVEKK